MGPQSWEEHRLLVMQSLEELKVSAKEIKQAQAEIHEEIIMLRVKSSLWGGLAGTVPAIIVGVIAWLKMV